MSSIHCDPAILHIYPYGENRMSHECTAFEGDEKCADRKDIIFTEDATILLWFIWSLFMIFIFLISSSFITDDTDGSINIYKLL